MPKYLVQASYTREGVAGLIKEGGSARKEAARRLVAELGGELESLYYAYGDDDAILIIDFPDRSSMATFAMTVTAADAADTRTTVLLTPEEMDEAARRRAPYRPPGD
jgi:uncharacterized protein with GYD domain